MWFSPVKEINKFLSGLFPAPAKTCKSPSGRPPKVSHIKLQSFNHAQWYGIITNQNLNLLERFSFSDESLMWLDKLKAEPEYRYGNWLAGLLGSLPDDVEWFVSYTYLAWVKDLLSSSAVTCKESIIRLSDAGAPLQLSFLLIYQYIVSVLDVIENEADDKIVEAYGKAHEHTVQMLWKGLSSLETYNNCCLGEKPLVENGRSELARAHDERHQLLMIALHAVGCLTELEEWISNSSDRKNQSKLQNYLIARSLPMFVEFCGRFGTRPWWTDAQVLLQEGMVSYCRITRQLPPDETLTDRFMDSDHLRYLGGLCFEEGEHMLSYMSISRYPKNYLSKLCLEFLEQHPQ